MRAQGGKKDRDGRKVGYAVVGLGHIAQSAVLPAFAHAENSRLVALVSSNAEKRRELAARYGVAQTFSYEELESCLALPEVDAVYLAVPNHLHAEFAVRCARAGAHVLCEKPMALSERECEEMIAAARQAEVRLMIAYRLHFEQANLRAAQTAASGELGELKYLESAFSFQVKPGNIRVRRETGGGVGWDIGIYCVNAARYLFRAEPTEVFAFTGGAGGDPRFSEVEESLGAVLRFPDGRLATFTCSFGASAVAWYRLAGTRGSLAVEHAYEYVGKRSVAVTVDDKTRRRTFAAVDQFGPELVYFSDCVKSGREPEPSGEEGLADVRVITALYESIRTGSKVALPPFARAARPTGEQRIVRPPVREAELVEASAPHQE